MILSDSYFYGIFHDSIARNTIPGAFLYGAFLESTDRERDKEQQSDVPTSLRGVLVTIGNLENSRKKRAL